MRLESIEAVNKILEEANKRIQPTGTGMKSGFFSIIRCYFIFVIPKISDESLLLAVPFLSRSIGELFGGLRGRLLDSNKNLVMQTLTTIGGVASAMGPTVEKASKVGDMSSIGNVF